MNTERPRTARFLSGRTAAYIAAVIACVFLFYGVYCFIQWYPKRIIVSVSGVVVDAETRRPIDQAHVLIVLHRNGFPYESYAGYGLITDEQGRFSIQQKASNTFSHIHVEASTPTNKYGMENDVRDYVVIEVKPLSERFQNRRSMHYDNFGGDNLLGHLSGRPLIFVDSDWSIDKR